MEKSRALLIASIVLIVILAVVIAISVILFPSADNSLNNNQNQQPSSLSEIGNENAGYEVVNPPFYALTSSAQTNGVTVNIKNNGGEDYTLKSFSVSNCGKIDLNASIHSGNVLAISVPCLLVSGTEFKGDITIEYTKASSQLTLSTTGNIGATVRALTR